jgi:erythromycin esterase
MAHNLLWLWKIRYPGKKIIVWAANYHIAKGLYNFSNESALQRITMGDIIARIAGNKMYSIGVTSHVGSTGRIEGTTEDLPQSADNSMESWMPPDYGFVYIDFNSVRHEGCNSQFYMKAINTNYLADWTRVYNGILFIRDMQPCKKTN